MPAPPLTNDFGVGIDGATIAISDTGSGDQWSVITGTPTYDDDHAHGGALSGAAIQTGVYARKSCEWTTLGSLTSNVYFRVYLWIDATATQVFSPLQVRGSSGACAQVVMKTNTFLQSLDAAAAAITPEGTVPYATGQWIRLEWRVKASTTVGETEIRWYLGDSTTPQETLISAATQVLAANIDQVRFGMTGTTGPAAQTIWFDDAAVSTTDWIGPAEVPLDDFNRADSASLGANWTSPVIATWSALGISSNQCYASSPFRNSYWNVAFAENQEVSAVLAAMPSTDQYAMLFCRIQNPNSGSELYYTMTVDNNGASYLGKHSDLFLAPVIGHGNPVYEVGDTLILRAVGSTIEARRIREGVETSLDSIVDSSITGSGYIGLGVSNDTDTRWDNFGGGSIEVAATSLLQSRSSVRRI